MKRTIPRITILLLLICGCALSETTQEGQQRRISERIRRIEKMLTGFNKQQERMSRIDPQTQNEEERDSLLIWKAELPDKERHYRALSDLKRYLVLKRDGHLVTDTTFALSHEAKISMTAEIIRYFIKIYEWETHFDSIFLSVPEAMQKDIKKMTDEIPLAINPSSSFVVGQDVKLSIGEAQPVNGNRVLFHVGTYIAPSAGGGYVVIFVNKKDKWVLELEAQHTAI